MERAEIEKLRWRCVRRGLLEVDIALSHFLATHFDTLADPEQRLFAELADMEDHDLWHLISAQAECADARFSGILGLLRKGAVSKFS
jgi:antitoxin CptB